MPPSYALVTRFCKNNAHNQQEHLQHLFVYTCVHVRTLCGALRYIQELIKKKEISLEDVIDYIDMNEMGKTYIYENDGIFTNQGLIFETRFVEENTQNAEYKIEEEEEFE